jgi:hypothetical protein
MDDVMEKFLDELRKISGSIDHVDIQLEAVTDIKKKLENIETLLTDMRDYLKDIHHYKVPEP